MLAAPVPSAFGFAGGPGATVGTRLDREQAAALCRLVAGAAALLVLATALGLDFAPAKAWNADAGPAVIIYTFAAIALLYGLLRWPHASRSHRYAAMILDIGILCVVAHAGGSATAFLYPLLLGIVFANGFTFGRHYGSVAARLALFGFGCVVVSTPYWHENPGLSATLLAGLVLLPAYVFAAAAKPAAAQEPASEQPPASASAAAVAAAAEAAEVPAQPEPQGEPPVAAEPPAAPRPSLSILVAEDNRTNQKVVDKILKHAGHRPSLVDSGQAALQALGREVFDLVLMDINLPGMNGIDATRVYRFASIGSQRVPFIAFTSEATQDAAARCAAAGMDGFFVKPIEPSRLIAYIDGLAIEPARPGPAVATSAPPAAEAPAAEAQTEPSAFDGVTAAAELERAEAGRSANAPADAAAAETVLDAKALQDLERLGGRPFVEEIVAQFVGDATAVLQTLNAAVNQGDVGEFREQAHALRSCAANVGARTIYELCLAWRELDAREIAIHGKEYMRQLEAAFEATLSGLGDYAKPEIIASLAQARNAGAAPADEGNSRAA